MTSNLTTAVPFADWGPNDRYWLDAFDPDSVLHRFLPVGPLEKIPFPTERLNDWERNSERRSRLVEAFEKSPLPFSSAQQRSIEALKSPRAMAVVTGQQPGALGGPLYTFAKILSAIVFAESLSNKWENPVVPILWDGGDDHDLEEIGAMSWLGGADGTPTERFDLSAYAGRSAWEVPFTDKDLEQATAFVEASHPPTEYRERTLEFLKAAWEEGVSWSDYFDRFWLKVFEESPLLVVRPWENGFRELAADIFAREIESPQSYLEDLSATSEELSSAGYSPRIHKTDGTCSFFYYIKGQRKLVQVEEGDSFTIEGKGSFSRKELVAAYRKEPGLLSPNALLRPLIQDAILPTAATVLGPSEIAYHAQLEWMYKRHQLPRPFILPRISLSLMGSSQRSKMEEWGLAVSDLRRNANEIAKSLVTSADLDSALAVLADLVDRTQTGRERILEIARGGKLDSEKGIESQFGRVEKTLNQISDLLKRDEMKRNSDLVVRIKGLQESLLPDGNLQERTVGLVPFLCRFGFDWLGSIREEARGWTGRDHVIYTP